MRHATRHALLLVTALAFVFGALGVTAPSVAAIPAGSYCADAEEVEFLRLMNNYRAQNGLGPMTLVQTLGDASEHHSASMANNNYFSHDLTPEGISWLQNVRNHGYSYNTYIGENIAAGSESAANTFEQWRTSPGHNANMLARDFNAIGVGRAYNANSTYRWYWTTDFGGHVDAAARVCGGGSTPPPPPPPVPACADPAAGQVVLFGDINYNGPCQTFAADDADLRDNAIGNDTVSSLKVGTGTVATLCGHIVFDGVCEAFTTADTDLRGNLVGNDGASSLRFGAVAPAPVPSPSPAPSGGTQLSIRSSTRTSNSNASNYAKDNNFSTAWYTTTGSPPSNAYIFFDLGASKSVGTIKWMWSQTGSADNVLIQVSTDRSRWTTMTTVGNASANTWQSFSTSTTARYVRFYFNNPNRDATLGHLAEVQIFS